MHKVAPSLLQKARDAQLDWELVTSNQGLAASMAHQKSWSDTAECLPYTLVCHSSRWNGSEKDTLEIWMTLDG